MTSPASMTPSNLLGSDKKEDSSSSANLLVDDFFQADNTSSKNKDILSHQHQELDLFLNQAAEYNLQTLTLQQQQQQQPLSLASVHPADIQGTTTPIKQEATSSEAAPATSETAPTTRSKNDDKKGKQKLKEGGQKSLLQVFTNPLLHAIPILARNCLNFEDFIAQTQPSGQGLLGPEAFEDDNDSSAIISSPIIKSDTPWHLRVLGLPHTGAKSRVETQIKICLQIADTTGELASNKWTHIKLPEHLVSKDKLKKNQTTGTRTSSNATANASQVQQQQLLNEDGAPAFIDSQVLTLEASVVCEGQPDTEIIMCPSCVHRECKRMKRKRDNKLARATNKAASASNAANEGGSGNAVSAAAAKIAALIATELPNLNDEKVMAEERKRILLFNCNEYVEFQSGEATLPTRITCYCRHHSEKTGFRIIFTLKDHLGHVIATGRSPPIMITDDHKSSKMQQLAAARKRSRTEMENATASATESDAPNRLATKSRKLLDLQETDSGVSSPVESTPATPSSMTQNEEHTGTEGNSGENNAKDVSTAAKTPASDSTNDVQTENNNATHSTLHASNTHQFNNTFNMSSDSKSNSINMDLATSTPHITTGIETTSLETFMATTSANVSNHQFVATPGQMYTQASMNNNVSDNGNENLFLSQLQTHAAHPSIYTPSALVADNKTSTNNASMFDFLGTDGLNMLAHSNHTQAPQSSSDLFYQQQPQQYNAVQNQQQQNQQQQQHQQEQILTHFDRLSNHQQNSLYARQRTPSSALTSAASSTDIVLSSQQSQQQQQHQFTNNIYARLAERNAIETKQAPHLPKLHRLIPSEGPIYGGAEVTVLGSNFYEGLTCLFGENPAIPTHCWSANTLLCILPPATTAGPVVVSFKEHPLMLEKGGQDVVLFTYFDESDRALMELALQVVGLKTMGKVEDARQIAMRIVQGGDNNSNTKYSTNKNSNSRGNHDSAHGGSVASNMTRMAITAVYENARSFYLSKLEEHIIASLTAIQQHYQCHSQYLSLTNQYGHSLLHLATLCNYVELVRLLVSQLNCNVNQVDRNGFTALHFASWTGNVELVNFLIDRTNLLITNNSGKTAEHLAMEGGHHSVINLFKSKNLQQKLLLEKTKTTAIPKTIRHHFLLPRLEVIQHYTSLLPTRLVKILIDLYKLSRRSIRDNQRALTIRTKLTKKAVDDILSKRSNSQTPCNTQRLINQAAGRQVYHFVLDL